MPTVWSIPIQNRITNSAWAQRHGRWLLLVGVAWLAFALVWWWAVADVQTALAVAQQSETQRRAQYQARWQQAASAPALRQQVEKIQVQLNRLEQNLPSEAEMNAVVADIHQAGRQRSVVLDWFKPEAPRIQAHYVVWPIAVRISGRYHDLGGFLADLAQLPRPVLLRNMVLTPQAQQTTPAAALNTAAATDVVVLEAQLLVLRRLTAAERAAAVPALRAAP